MLATEGGTVTSSNGTYDDGSTVSLAATPGAGYSFTGWYEGETLISENTSFTVTVTDGKTYTAKFTEILSSPNIEFESNFIYIFGYNDSGLVDISLRANRNSLDDYNG